MGNPESTNFSLERQRGEASPYGQESPELVCSPVLKVMNYKCWTIRWATLRDEPWWVAQDVCKALGIENVGKAVHRLDADEKLTITMGESPSEAQGGAKDLLMVNEPGLYQLILRSRKPEARALRRWLTHEVLPILWKDDTSALSPRSFPVSLREAEQQHKIMMFNRILKTDTTFDLWAMNDFLAMRSWDPNRIRCFLSSRRVSYQEFPTGKEVVSPYFVENDLFKLVSTTVCVDNSHRTYRHLVATISGLEWLLREVESEVGAK